MISGKPIVYNVYAQLHVYLVAVYTYNVLPYNDKNEYLQLN